MNSFGTLFKVQIFGESHGDCVGALIDGCPAGLPLQQSHFVEDMERRKGGKQKGTTPRQEDDIPFFIADFDTAANDKSYVCPRTLLKKVIVL